MHVGHCASLFLAITMTGLPTQSYTPSPVPAAPPVHAITYTDTHYGFRFFLPRTWLGYTVLTGGSWSGTPTVNGEPLNDPASLVKGPLLRIRHPHWTKANPYEDIPIMIFTRAQWTLVENETLIMGAAPFPPSELARNAKYVFALPARYNYDYATGWEEVEKIIDTRPIHPLP